MSCQHEPKCPGPQDPDREAAHVIVSHPEQGWSLLCNGVVIFDDTGELLPDGSTIGPHRPDEIVDGGRRVYANGTGRSSLPASVIAEYQAAQAA